MCKEMEWQDLGTMPYRQAWALQNDLRNKRIAGEIGDRLLLVEHPPVFTIGRRDSCGDFRSSPEAIAVDSIDVVKTNRGGRVTYHGPGQLVAYFIFDLSGIGVGVAEFVWLMGQSCIRLLADYGINAAHDPDHPGIWVGRDKMCAIGLNVSRGVTQHGLAINVSCDLTPYRHIVACGINNRGVTSMARIIGKTPPMAEIKRQFVAKIEEVLRRKCQSV